MAVVATKRAETPKNGATKESAAKSVGEIGARRIIK
jgi:hypothetical protein